jgi:hypothetical protein
VEEELKMSMRNPENIRTYSELNQLESFEDRFLYLLLNGRVGQATFGFDRYINQKFYRSPEWKSIRDRVIIRDNACDLGDPDREIYGTIYVHHMNPIHLEDIEEATDYLFNEEFLICTSRETHDAIHYGDDGYLERNTFALRTPNDMSPWKKRKRRD